MVPRTVAQSRAGILAKFSRVWSLVSLSLACASLQVAMPQLPAALAGETSAQPAPQAVQQSSSQSASESASQNSSQNSLNSTQSKTSPLLSGGVQHSVKDAQIAVKDLGDTAKQLKDNAWFAFCEVQQQDEVYVGGPNVVGGMVIPAVGGSGFLSTGQFLPPRPKWLNYFIQNVDYMSRQLDVEIANTQMPDDLSDNGKQSFARMVELARAIPAKVMNLEGTAKPPYKNMPIAVAAQEVLDDLKEFEKMQKVVQRELKNLSRKKNRK